MTERVATNRNGRRMRVLLDDVDADLLERSWSVAGRGYLCRQRTMPGERPQTIYMHTIILERMGFPKGSYDVADHINRDVRDNRRENLRPATWSQSNRNRSGWRRA